MALAPVFLDAVSESSSGLGGSVLAFALDFRLWTAAIWASLFARNSASILRVLPSTCGAVSSIRPLAMMIRVEQLGPSYIQCQYDELRIKSNESPFAFRSWEIETLGVGIVGETEMADHFLGRSMLM